MSHKVLGAFLPVAGPAVVGCEPNWLIDYILRPQRACVFEPVHPFGSAVLELTSGVTSVGAKKAEAGGVGGEVEC